jgi:crotonobetainyl-CoA:carnitine CoA-transferase CaiB-like acyl-CoA transferase
MDEPRGILAGIRVVEVATYVFAPGAATVMSDFGAEVIKVERPGIGDPYRYLSQLRPMPASEMNYCWLLDGRNKRSIVLDLAAAAGREVLLRLVATADVFITNCQRSVLRKLALEYDDLAPLCPRLVYAHATGYGEEGEEVEKPGFDLTAYWARSGLMDSVHSGDAHPGISVAGMGDHPSALALFGAILLALYDRERSGRGAAVSSSLAANGAWANSCLVQAALCGAVRYLPRTRTTPVNPLVNHYVTRDGKRFIFCLIQAEKDWPALARALGLPELLEDGRFATAEARAENAPALVAILDAALARRDMAEWARLFAAHDLTWSPVATVDDVACDPQLAANGAFPDLDHPVHGRIRVVDSPIAVRGRAKTRPRPAPDLGQDTMDVLGMLGYDGSQIADLLRRGVAFASPGAREERA